MKNCRTFQLCLAVLLFCFVSTQHELPSLGSYPPLVPREHHHHAVLSDQAKEDTADVNSTEKKFAEEIKDVKGSAVINSENGQSPKTVKISPRVTHLVSRLTAKNASEGSSNREVLLGRHESPEHEDQEFLKSIKISPKVLYAENHRIAKNPVEGEVSNTKNKFHVKPASPSAVESGDGEFLDYVKITPKELHTEEHLTAKNPVDGAVSNTENKFHVKPASPRAAESGDGEFLDSVKITPKELHTEEHLTAKNPIDGAVSKTENKFHVKPASPNASESGDGEFLDSVKITPKELHTEKHLTAKKTDSNIEEKFTPEAGTEKRSTTTTNVKAESRPSRSVRHAEDHVDAFVHRASFDEHLSRQLPPVLRKH